VVLEENLKATPISVKKSNGGLVTVSYAGDRALLIKLDPFQVRRTSYLVANCGLPFALKLSPG
jgi:hypothetical protein